MLVTFFILVDFNVVNWYPSQNLQTNFSKIVFIYNKIEYNTTQHNTIQYNTMQCSAMQNCTMHYTVQYKAIQYNISVLHLHVHCSPYQTEKKNKRPNPGAPNVVT